MSDRDVLNDPDGIPIEAADMRLSWLVEKLADHEDEPEYAEQLPSVTLNGRDGD